MEAIFNQDQPGNHAYDHRQFLPDREGGGLCAFSAIGQDLI